VLLPIGVSRNPVQIKLIPRPVRSEIAMQPSTTSTCGVMIFLSDSLSPLFFNLHLWFQIYIIVGRCPNLSLMALP